MQAIARFGAPLAVLSPMLLGLGVRPLYAVLLSIIGGAWANSFGSLGAPWLALEIGRRCSRSVVQAWRSDRFSVTQELARGLLAGTIG